MVFGAVDPAASPESRALAPGTLLHEYRIDKVLGAGAFGVTYKATDMNLSIPVAIKEFMPEDLVHRGADGNVTLNDSSHEKLFSWARGRFIGEAQVLAQFRHPNIVRVSRYFGDRGTAYFVMDYAEGKSLERCAAWAGPHPDERRLVEIFIPVMEGLREVHRKKYLHRDIKPANIYLREDDTAMLIDFGAAMLEISHSSDELANVLTHGYAPPEQYARSARQGPQSDIYSLGATLYRLLSEQRPVPANRRRTRILAGEPDPQPPARRLAAAGSANSSWNSSTGCWNWTWNGAHAALTMSCTGCPRCSRPDAARTWPSTAGPFSTSWCLPARWAPARPR